MVLFDLRGECAMRLPAPPVSPWAVITNWRVSGKHESYIRALPLAFFSPRGFLAACGAASIGPLAGIVLIILRGDRELEAIDFVLSELHLGATYDAILRRRLWHRRQFDVLLIPLVILALTYAFSLGGQTILLTSIAMYAAVWHRGRQSLGVARFYQRGVGGPVSRTHEALFRGAIYLPMLAAALAYASARP